MSNTKHTKRDILKSCMSSGITGETPFDFLDDEERPMIYEAMQQWSDVENKQLSDINAELLEALRIIRMQTDQPQPTEREKFILHWCDKAIDKATGNS